MEFQKEPIAGEAPSPLYINDSSYCQMGMPVLDSQAPQGAPPILQYPDGHTEVKIVQMEDNQVTEKIILDKQN